MKFEAPRGTHDILPSDQPLWQRVVGEAERLCALYGYRRIDTPGFEDTDLFVRTSGGGSDVVQKEMYTFEDRGGRSLTLRPEATAPICRAYLEHGMQRDPQPVKLYTIGPMWRYERPQKGRYREHWQLSVEAIGSDDPAVDAELIQLYDELLRSLGVRDYTLELNSIGDANCRPAYVERLQAWLDEHDDELDDEARGKRATTPLRVFDVKSERMQALLSEAPKIGESLCDACREHFDQVRSLLEAVGVAYELQPTLVRGLDYYTRTTFEFKDEAIGAKSTIVGGGRYDGLIEAIGGPPTPGIGFGAGIERLLLSLGEPELEPQAIDVFFVIDEGADRTAIAKALAELRRRGISADMDYAGRSVKGQRTQASRLNAREVVVVEPGRPPGRRRDRKGARQVTWRDEHAGDLRTEDVGRTVTLAGWAARRRDHGGLIFVDLRDHTGLGQLVINPERSPEAAKTAHEIRNEFVLQATGDVVARAPEAVNPNLPTGEVEVQVDELRIISRSTPLPFQLDEENVDETLRLRYRWLDMRRDEMQRNLRLSHVVIASVRKTDGRARFRRCVDAEHDQGDA